MATLKLAVFWSSRRLTSLRGTGASALPSLAIFHSLSTLQLWLDCTQMCDQLPPSRRHCIPAQHRRAAMTHSSALPPACCALTPAKLKLFFFVLPLQYCCNYRCAPPSPLSSLPHKHHQARPPTGFLYALPAQRLLINPSPSLSIPPHPLPLSTAKKFDQQILFQRAILLLATRALTACNT